MDIEDLARAVDRSTRSAFRLETLPQYLVPQEAEEFAAWRAGRPVPLQTPATSPWLEKIQTTTSRGYRWYRVHVIDHPLSDYLRYELYGYQANAAAGEEIYIADRRDHPDLEHLREDFWLIDDTTAVRMVYDVDGRFLRPEPVQDVTPYLLMRDTVLRHAEPLAGYLARTHLRLTA
jgi:hypothetical protein